MHDQSGSLPTGPSGPTGADEPPGAPAVVYDTEVRSGGRWRQAGRADHRTLTFTTEEDGDSGRPPTGRLRLLLDDGHSLVERITWRDGHGTFASVALRTRPDIATLCRWR